MKPIRLSPWLICALALLLVLAAGCDRPEPQAPLATPTPGSAPVQPQAVDTVAPEAATPTLPVAVETMDLGVVTPGPEVTSSTPEQPQPEQTPLVPTQPPPQPTPVPQGTPQAAAATNPGTHTVQSGETLFSIGRLYNVNPYAIAAANNVPYPYIIYPGQQLTIPGGTTAPGQTPVPPQTGGCRYYHTVRPGENLFRISLAYGVPMSTIAAANGIVNYNLIYAGQTLCIP